MATMLGDMQGTGQRLGGATPANWYGLGVLVVITLFGYVDRQVFVLLAEPLRIDLGLSDTELGALQGLGIAFFAAIAAYPVGWLADRFDRRYVLVCCILAWSAAVAACGLAPNFGWLLVFSGLLGIGEAGLIPIAYAMIPELVPDPARVTANAVYTVATTLGIGLASTFCAGLIVFSHVLRPLLPVGLAGLPEWRLVFLLVAVPAPLFVALMFSVRQRRSPPAIPQPGVLDAGEAIAGLAAHIKKYPRTVLGFFAGNALATFGFASIINWVPVIVMRLHGVTAAAAGSATGIATLIATVAGFVLGIVGNRVMGSRFGPRFPIVAIWTATALAALMSFMLLFATTALQIFVLQGVQYALIMGAFMIFPTAMQDLAPPHLRARLIALSNVSRMILLALSPLVVGAVSDRLAGTHSGILYAAAGSATVGLVLAALAFWWAGGRYAETVAASR